MAEEKEIFLRSTLPLKEDKLAFDSAPNDLSAAENARRSNKSRKEQMSKEGDVAVRQPAAGPKYSQALKTLCPLRCSKPPKDTLPLDSTGFISYMTFGWLTPYMWRVYKKGVAEIQGLHHRDKETAEVSAQRMDKFWLEEVTLKGREEASFGRVIFRAFRTRIIIGLFASFLSALLTLANSVFVIRYFLEYLSEGDVSLKSGIIYAILLGLTILLHGLTGGFYWMLNIEAAARIKYGSLAMLYKKVLCVKNFREKTVGDIVNFISNDGQRIWDAVIMGPIVTGTPIVLIFSCIYSIVLLGPWALVGWLITIGFLPFAVGCAMMSMKFREASIKFTDKRVSFTTELLTCIKMIKMYSWEECFGQKILETRSSEQHILEKSVINSSIAMGSSMLIPIFASIITFIAYVATGNNLTPTQAFTFVSLLNTMQGSLLAVPFSLKALSEAKVTVTRLKEILLLDEFEDSRIPVSDSGLAVEVVNANIAWDNRSSKQDSKEKEPKAKQKRGLEEEETMADNHDDDENSGQIYTAPVIHNITFILKRGDMLGVCGHVGCGKSSLITALLGRMNVTSGTVAVSGRIAYVSQQAWITNDSIKNNVLFGEDFDEVRYNSVIDACALRQDINSLPARDDTVVGEQGATLSGGQKQRISLARAAYSNCDLILLDDPLSAVDVHIGQHIFKHCIMGLMKGSTTVFVTHQLQYLHNCTSVLVLKEGMVVEHGSHEDLMACEGEYASLVNLSSETNHHKVPHSGPEGDQNTLESEHQDKIEHSRCNGGSGINQADVDEVQKDTDSVLNLVERQTSALKQGDEGQFSEEEEELGTGSLSWPVLRQYIEAMGGVAVFLCVLLCFSLPVAGVTTAGWYLTYWLGQGGGGALMKYGNTTVLSKRVVDHPAKEDYLIVYAMFIPILIILLILRSCSLTKATLKAATSLHNKAFTKVLYSPMLFFDSTPSGQIVNRFSADQDEVDVRLPMNAEVFLTNILQVIAVVAMIAYVSPWFLIAVIPFGALFFFLMLMFHTGVTIMKRLDNVTRSPVIGHMGASCQGVATIQAYHKSKQFVQRHCQLLNSNSVAVFLFYTANRWLALRMDILSAAIAFLTGLLILLTYDHLNPALAGLAISYCVQLSSLFQFTARLFIETEARFTSVQRILKYCNLIQQEPTTHDSLPHWPSKGSIKFERVHLRYRDYLPLALNDVSLSIAPQEKIGIVGRTAAGKSSLAAAIFRLVQLERGHISIDGHDISKIDIHKLRSNISIIPQDPILFSGTIRYNLDPFDQHNDADIWQALSKCHIQDMVKRLEHQLITNIEETGGNFSLGERQLLCMARALLRNSKILILDEATAAIDAETDSLVQSTLRDAFSTCTMLTIAHRLNTVTNCDRILVLKDGKVHEFDSPSKLLADPHSEFKSMFDSLEGS